MSAERRAGAPVHLPALDGYRGFAALCVTIYHCWLFTDAPLGRGPLRALVASLGLGVEMFFVLSGFVLFLPVVRHGGRFGSLRAYARRRAARIFPAYFVALVIQAALAPWLAGVPSPFLGPGGLATFATHLLFLQHETPRWVLHALGWSGPVMGFGVNGALWSLSVEVLFYAALPFVAGGFFRHPGRGLALAVAGGAAWRALAWNAPSLAVATGAATAVGGVVPRLVEQIPGFAGQFACGMAAAWLFAQAAALVSAPGGHADGAAAPGTPGGMAAALDGSLTQDRSPNGSGSAVGAAALQPGVTQGLAAWVYRHATALVALGGTALLASLVAAGALGGANGGVYARQLDDLLPAAAFAVLLLATPLAGSRLARVASSRVARWTGDVSYGCFLWHLPLILFFTNVLGILRGPGDAAFLGLSAVVVPSALGLGWLSRHWVEEPAMAWARTRAARRDSGGGTQER